KEHVVLHADERQTSRGLFAEVAGGVHGNSGRDRAEQHQEESRERVHANVEGQIGQPERQRQGLRGQPHRLEAQGRERDAGRRAQRKGEADRKSTRLNSSHLGISYAVFCLKKKKKKTRNENKKSQTNKIIVELLK